MDSDCRPILLPGDRTPGDGWSPSPAPTPSPCGRRERRERHLKSSGSVPCAFTSAGAGCYAHFTDGETESPNHASFWQNCLAPALCQGLFWALGPHQGTRQIIPALWGLAPTKGTWLLIASHGSQEEAGPGWERVEGKTSSGRCGDCNCDPASDFASRGLHVLICKMGAVMTPPSQGDIVSAIKPGSSTPSPAGSGGSTGQSTRHLQGLSHTQQRRMFPVSLLPAALSFPVAPTNSGRRLGCPRWAEGEPKAQRQSDS